MSDGSCVHLEDLEAPADPVAAGCVECLATGGSWVHLRVCVECGHVGCCDDSPGTHTTKHVQETGHPIVRSFEPGEDWWYCYPDDLAFGVDGYGALRPAL